MARTPKHRSDEDILTELRERFDYGTAELREIRDEAAKDMRYVAGDCWDESERKLREDVKRPVLEVDELSQYLNQTVNDVRQNKRGIKVTPTGNGATDQTAAFRQGKIRDIEYRSNAQQAYTTMFENAVQRSYGFLRVKARFTKPDLGFDQELVIEPIVNPDCVTPDPDHQRPDGTDMNWLIYHEEWAVTAFRRAYPDAQIKDFNAEVQKRAPQWIKGQRIQLAEYWTKESAGRKRLLKLKPVPPTRDNPHPQPLEVEASTLHAMPSSDQILQERTIDAVTVMQYLTNGVEILERTTWPGQSIPFVTCYGKVLFLTESGVTKKKILSMIRLARSPQMLYAYYRSKEAEIAKLIPLAPVVGVVGQFRGQEHDWAEASDVPRAYVQYHATTDATGSQVLPPPQRMAYEAGSHLQALEGCAEGARRAIQAAMGISPLPTQAQRRNEKSGVALKQIEDSAQKGSFHFVDHYDEAIARTGTILEELIGHYYGTAQETAIRKPDDAVAMVRINDPQARYSASLEPAPPGAPNGNGHAPIQTTQGDHDVTISVGPRESSEREANADFAQSLIQNPQLAQIVGPQKMSEILAASIRLLGIGPIGDEIAEIISPKHAEADPKQIQQQLGEMKQKIEQLGQALQAADQIIKTKQTENQGKIEQVKVEADKDIKIQMMRDATAIRVAQIAASTKGIVSANEARDEALALLQDQQHEADQAAFDRQHDMNLAQQAHAHTLDQADQGHQQAMEQGDQGQANALEQGQQAAELAQPPDAGAGA